MTADERRAAIRARKGEGGRFLTDEEVRSYTGWNWSLSDRQLVRDALDAIPHDVDCSWLPAGGVYIALHRDGQYIVGLHGGTVRVSHDAPDANAFFTERLGPSYRISNNRSFDLFTLPSGGGPQTQSSGARSSRATDTAMCPRCSAYPLTATGKCMGGCDD